MGARPRGGDGSADASFDAVVCRQGFQFFPDQPAALREIHGVLAPGERVCISMWKSAGPYNIAVGNALEQHVNAATASASRYNPTPMVKARCCLMKRIWR